MPSFAKETWFYVREGAKFERKETTAESSKLSASVDVDPELRAALTDGESGLMRSGALPQLTTAMTAGNKALLDAIDKATHGWGVFFWVGLQVRYPYFEFHNSIHKIHWQVHC